MMTQTCNTGGRKRDCCSQLAGALDPRFFKALCDPSRVAILARLAGSGRACTVSEIAACCPTDLSVVSRHLLMLRQTGIVASQRRGKEVYYSVCFTEISQSLRRLADAIDACCPPRKPGAAPRATAGKARTT